MIFQTHITIDSIIHLLPSVADRGWVVHEGGGRIRDREGRCPICSLAHQLSGGKVDEHVTAFASLKKLLGRKALLPKEIDEIGQFINAADRNPRSFLSPGQPVRSRILQELGLKEQS